MNSRNGCRRREWDTRAGTVELAIPKLRQGSCFPEWLLERRRRAERALATVVATSCLLGVSTRRVEKLAESLGVTKLSKSQVSVMAAELDEMVASFRSRPLDAGPYTFGGWRSCAAWPPAACLACGWSPPAAITGCHHGLRDAIAAVLPGACWQRCRAHYARNLATRVPSPPSRGWPPWCGPSSSSPTRPRCGPSTPRTSPPWRRSSRRPRPTSMRPATTSWRSPRSRMRSGGRSGATTPRNG